MLFDVFFEGDGDHRDLHVLTHSFPTRRSSDLWSQCASASSTTSRIRSASLSAGMTTATLPRCRGVRASPAATGSAMCDLHAQHAAGPGVEQGGVRSEEHTSELQSLMRISYAVFCLKKKTTTNMYNSRQI